MENLLEPKELVSIIMPCYNCEQYLAEVVYSIINQTYQNWELILVDDCSMDNSAQIIKSFLKLDQRIRGFFNERNKGVSFSRNIGLKESRGIYIAFCDSDDLWDLSKLQIQIPFLKRYPVVCSNYIMFSDLNKKNKLIKGPKKFDYDKLLKTNLIPNSSAVFNRRLVNCGVLQKNIGHEDYLMWLELLKPNKKVYRVQKPLMFYRLHKKSISSNKIRSLRWTWNVYFNELKLGLIKSLFLMSNYIFNNFKKYFI